MNKYIIGIDGGGTSTDGVLFTVDGVEIKRVQEGYANFRVNQDVAKQNIITTINRLVEEVPLETLATIQIGVAGVPEESVKQAFIQYLEERYNVPVGFVTDAEIALHSIQPKGNDCVIMVLGGTGSAIMIKDDTKHNMIGGFGHLLGDEGSGYHLAITALKEIIKQYEQNKPITPLSKAILNKINASSYFDIKNYVYGQSKQEIASLSRFIAEFATQGDTDAIELFKEQGKHLARQTILALNKVDGCKQLTIGFRGNFLLHAPYVKETLLQELDNNKINYAVDSTPVDPVKGAFYLGLQRIQTR